MDELLATFKAVLIGSGTTEDELTGKDEYLTHLLKASKQRIERKLYPFDLSKTILDTDYREARIDIAVILFNKSGAEGEKSHNEGGINRTYENADIPNSLYQSYGIVPYCGLPTKVGE